MKYLIQISAVVLMAIGVQGCILQAPAAGYYVPDSLSPGDNSFGFGFAAGFLDLRSGDAEARHLELDFLWDNGITGATDIRIRLTGYLFSGPKGFSSAAAGPGFELKWTFAGDYAAFLFGTHMLFYAGEEFYAVCSGTTGLVFGIGTPGNLRVLLSPRLTVPFNAWEFLQGVFSVGLDIPAQHSGSLRPEVGVICLIPVVEEAELICTLGAGLGMLF